MTGRQPLDVAARLTTLIGVHHCSDPTLSPGHGIPVRLTPAEVADIRVRSTCAWPR